MKIAFAFVVGCLVVLTVSAAPEYTNKWDNVDLDAILANDRLYDHYCKCLLGEVRCPPDGEEVKQRIPSAIQNECAECSEKQKAGVDKVITFTIQNKPDCWNALKQKYDSEGKYKNKYGALEAEAEKKREAAKSA